MLKAKGLSKLGLLLLVAIFVLAGCGSGEKATEKSGSEGSKDKNALEQIKERDKIVVGVKNDTRLFGLKDPKTGKIEGFDVDIAKEIAKEILGDENKIELKEVTSKTRIPMLNNGQIDAIVATMTISEERKKEVDFTDVYFNAGQSLLVKKDSPIKGLDDIKKGVKVLAVKGSTSAINIREKAPEATVLEFENYTEAFNALKAGQGDALTTDDAILYGMIDQDPNYRLAGKTFTEEPYGIAVRKGETELVEKINEVLKNLKASGKYDEIYKKWIKEEQAQ